MCTQMLQSPEPQKGMCRSLSTSKHLPVSFGTFSFEASLDAQRAKFLRRTSWYVEEVCDGGSSKSTKWGRTNKRNCLKNYTKYTAFPQGVDEVFHSTIHTLSPPNPQNRFLLLSLSSQSPTLATKDRIKMTGNTRIDRRMTTEDQPVVQTRQIPPDIP